MDWRYRRYYTVRLPCLPYSYNKYIKLIKSVPTVKVHPVKYSVSFTSGFHRSTSQFPDESERRGYHHIMVSVRGFEERKWLLAGLDMMCKSEKIVSYKEILPKGADTCES
jgi:hypothetical protein